MWTAKPQRNLKDDFLLFPKNHWRFHTERQLQAGVGRAQEILSLPLEPSNALALLSTKQHHTKTRRNARQIYQLRD